MVGTKVIAAVIISAVLAGIVPVSVCILLIRKQRLSIQQFRTCLTGSIWLAFANKALNVALTSVDFIFISQTTINTSLAFLGGIISAVTVCFCTCSCTSKTHSSKESYSAAAGFGTGYLISAAVGMLLLLWNFHLVNTDSLDSISVTASQENVQVQGAMISLIDYYTTYSVKKAFIQLVIDFSTAMLYIGVSLFIIRSALENKHLASSVIICAGMFSLVNLTELFISQEILRMLMILAAGTAWLVLGILTDARLSLSDISEMPKKEVTPLSEQE